MALIALAVGAVVAVLGVQASVDAYRRQQAISQYAHARATAVYFVKNGATISRSMERLQALDEEDVSLMTDAQAALEAQNISSFNAFIHSSNNRNKEQQSLDNQVKRFQAGFERELSR